MSKEFIENKTGSTSIVEARKQQKQLAYFTQSEIQQDINQEYLTQWAERKFSGNDDFLNWVKGVFKTDNFMSFFKYFRNPLPSARIVNDRIKPQLQRVFFSEDSFFKYTINGESTEAPEELEVNQFNEWMFNALLFRHNDILITDLKDINTPFRDLISIENVVAIESRRSVIHRLAYTAQITKVDEATGEKSTETGFLYMDAFEYIFYNSEVEPILTIPHDLGECPADYVAREPMSNDDIIRKSIFSYVRSDFEEYVFLKTIQKMTEPNGSVPVISILKSRGKGKGDEDFKGGSDKAPMTSREITGQRAETGKAIQPNDIAPQAGTIYKIPVNKKNDGSIDMDAVKNYINFYYLPVEAMEYLRARISEIEANIITSVLGDFKESNEKAMNELQISKGFVSKEDVLRGVSLDLSRIRTRSDFKFLALQHGQGKVTNEGFYGSDFFTESESHLFELFEKSPNTIERKNLLIRLTKNRNRFNKDKSKKEVILYHLLPYISDADFLAAREQFAVDPITFQYQSRFNYWIGVFESQFGDLLMFWNVHEDKSNAEKLLIINNLILEIIKDSGVPIVAILPEKTPANGEN